MGLAHRSTLTRHHTGKWLVYLHSCTGSCGRNTVSKAWQDPLPMGEAGRACPIEKWYSVDNRSCRFSGIQPEPIPELILEPLTGLHSDSSCTQAGQNGLLGSPSNSFRDMTIPGKTVRSCYRIGVPGWAPISKACLEWAVTALLEIIVIVPQRIHSK